MDLFRGLPLPTSPCPTALAIGNFDGVHCGHQALIDALKAHARPRNLACAVMTFEPHPREYFAARAGKPENAPLRVSTLRDRLEALAQHGVSITFLLRFADVLASMSAEDFVHKLLVNACRARLVMVGEDFRFGAKRAGDVALLKAMGAQFGFTVATLSDVKEDGQRISSTMVRRELLSAAHAKMTKGLPLTSVIYVPETFAAERASEIKQRQVQALARLAAGPNSRMILIGEVKSIAEARFGKALVVRHMPDLRLMMSEDLYTRLNNRFSQQLSLWGQL